ncbi:MAG: DUF5021 domain-containing protein [Ruminiclostridium sp.]|nr:DUF5021 domain-containing protein [Ruminiclostridium sp.]
MTKLGKITGVLLSAALMASVFCFSSCGNGDTAPNDTARASEDQNTENAVVLLALTEAANSTAKTIKNAVDVHLTNMDTMGMGVKLGSGIKTITITVSNGEVTADEDPSMLKNAANKDEFNSKLADYIKKEVDLPDNAEIKCYSESGMCKYVVYYNGGSSMPYDVPNANDFKAESFGWKGSTDGTTANGDVIGTYPVLKS